MLLQTTYTRDVPVVGFFSTKDLLLRCNSRYIAYKPTSYSKDIAIWRSKICCDSICNT